LAATDDSDVDFVWDFVLTPDGEKLHACTWHTGQLLTFDRSPLDGSLKRAYDKPLFNAAGIAITPDGARVYASGDNKPWQLVRYDIDSVTGEPVQTHPSPVIGRELALAHGGSLLFESTGEAMGTGILSFLVNPMTGALEPGPTTPHPSIHNFTL